jgi:hypothetical protein
MKLLSKKEVGQRRVYDIEVEDVHNFYANGVNVHNCATDGGVSVIKDDGTVVDLLDVASTVTDGVSFDDQNTLYVHDEGRKNVEVYYTIPSVDVTDSPDDVYNEANAPYLFGSNTGANLIPLAFGGNYLAISKQEASGTDEGLSLLASNKANASTGMVAYITSTYNTGWMNGAIRGAFLADTDDTDLVGSGELVTNGTFDTDLTGWTDASTGSGYASWSAGTLEVYRLDSSNAGYIYQTISCAVGDVFQISAERVSGSGAAMRIGSTAGGNQIYDVSLGPGVTIIFVKATSALISVGFRGGDNGSTTNIDNISVKLADADRSVNG